MNDFTLGSGKSDMSTFFVLAMHISTYCSVLFYGVWLDLRVQICFRLSKGLRPVNVHTFPSSIC